MREVRLKNKVFLRLEFVDIKLVSEILAKKGLKASTPSNEFVLRLIRIRD